MQEGSYIKLYRSMTEWEWYGNINTCRLFIHMLLKANWKDGKFEGKVIPRGSFVSSIGILAKETSLTNDEVRTALKHLIFTKEITKQNFSKFTVFTVVRYNDYQELPKQVPNQIPSSSQPVPNLFPTIEEDKKGKKRKNINNIMCNADASALFEELWKLYPVKKGKGQISIAAKQRLLKVGHDEMIRAIDRYKSELEKDKDWRRPQNGSTFFNSGYVDYLDANYEPSKRNNANRCGFNDFEQRQYDYDELEKKLSQ